MKTEKIVAVTGSKGAGKDTAIQELLTDEGYTLVKFAEGLKAMLRTYLTLYGEDKDTIERMLEGDLKEKPCDAFCGRTPRHAMQTLGTEWGRMCIGPKVWTNLYKKQAGKRQKIATTDLRFLNELVTLKELKEEGADLLVVRIEKVAKMGEKRDTHISEIEMESLPADVRIENVGTISELRQKMKAATNR